MAVKKVYECDLCSTGVPRGQLVVMRIGKADDRPEDAIRVDVCPECLTSRSAGQVVDAAARLRSE